MPSGTRAGEVSVSMKFRNRTQHRNNFAPVVASRGRAVLFRKPSQFNLSFSLQQGMGAQSVL